MMITPIAAGTVPWPGDLAQKYRAEGWWRGQPLGAGIAAVADVRKTATALVDGATRISYESLMARADGLAGRLTGGLGLQRGDRIVVQLPNCWQFVVLTLGCLRAGIVPVMALPAHRQHELAYLCQHSEARALAVPGVLRDFDHQALAEQLRAGSVRGGSRTRGTPGPAGPGGRRGVPALRRDHRAAEADRPHPR